MYSVMSDELEKSATSESNDFYNESAKVLFSSQDLMTFTPG